MSVAQMDVLLADSDPTSPVSAADLRRLISRLEHHSLRIKSNVHTYLTTHHPHFSSLFSQSTHLLSRSSLLHTHLLSLLSNTPLDSTLQPLIDHSVAKRKALKVKTEVLELVGVVLELSRGLGDVMEGVGGGSVKEAAELLRDLKEALWHGGDEGGEEEKSDGREPLVYALLQEEWSRCFEEIQNTLVKFMEDAVRFNQEDAFVSVKYWLKCTDADLVKLPTVLEAMDAVGVLDYGLAKIADMMIKYIITPIVNGQATVSTTDEMDEYPEKISETVLNMVPLTGAKIIPNDASKLADFQKTVKLSSEFESELKDLVFISSDSKDQRLSIFADNVEVHFASRKKVEILTKARELLLQSEFNIPQQFMRRSESNEAVIHSHTVDLLFTSEKCIISGAARNLMELVHQTLKFLVAVVAPYGIVTGYKIEHYRKSSALISTSVMHVLDWKDVCVSSPRVGIEFYHAARDALLLYEAVIPVKLERQLESVNQAAVLIHNDCLYLSTEVIGLAFEYRSGFPNKVKEHAVFIDLSPRLQMLGEQIFQREIQLVLYNLTMAIDGADGFQNTHRIKQYESAKFSIDQVIFILEKVRMIWEPLLLPSTYEKSMSLVLESVFSKISKDILLLDDMAAEETLQLRNLILLLLENSSPLLDSLLANNKRSKSKVGELHLDPIPLPSLQKLRKLADLLDMPLKSITASWESGELVSCGFTLSEVKDFIRAIFTDSPLRKECLFRIENSLS
ncbi:hypothetical protein Leryth_019482 [Lithospermum erythrorhizon]|nr:hypothetical protein Leryth_019482 [Lithospermum erythrorhizon]